MTLCLTYMCGFHLHMYAHKHVYNNNGKFKNWLSNTANVLSVKNLVWVIKPTILILFLYIFRLMLIVIFTTITVQCSNQLTPFCSMNLTENST